jgi:hydrogenase expression/formation protein HypD
MKYLHEFRAKEPVRRCADAIHAAVTRPWTLMEVCGGQTNTIVRHALDTLLPAEITLIHGPGCPVCVTPVDVLDKAHEIAADPRVIFCTFGDMLRVPGSRTDLFEVKARGGDVRVVHSPLDAVKVAADNPGREVVFFAVGFETTAPANAMSVLHARQAGLRNYSLLVSHVLVPPAIEAIMAAPGNRVQGFLAAGHVCAVMGTEEYRPLAARYRVPIVVTGFEPLDILQGVLMCVRQLEHGRHEVENQYTRAVREPGNEHARECIRQVFTTTDRHWRGIGSLPQSGLRLRDELSDYDALRRFGDLQPSAEPESECISGLVLQGIRKPADCPAFGTRCTPETPLGATMVSHEGACAAYFKYRPQVQP